MKNKMEHDLQSLARLRRMRHRLAEQDAGRLERNVLDLQRRASTVAGQVGRKLDERRAAAGKILFAPFMTGRDMSAAASVRSRNAAELLVLRASAQRIAGELQSRSADLDHAKKRVREADRAETKIDWLLTSAAKVRAADDTRLVEAAAEDTRQDSRR